MNTLKLVNGNKQPYTIGLPLLHIQGKMNSVALDHVAENTGLYFVEKGFGLEAQPEIAEQIAALLLTYNFKTRYFNNASVKNTLFLKSDHHIGFDVDSICLDCVKHNHIHVGDLKQGDRLAC